MPSYPALQTARSPQLVSRLTGYPVVQILIRGEHRTANPLPSGQGDGVVSNVILSGVRLDRGLGGGGP